MNTEEDTNLQSLTAIFMMMPGPGQDPVGGGDKADTVPSSTSWGIYALTEETVHNTWEGSRWQRMVLRVRAPGRRKSSVLLGKEDIPVHPSCT